MLTTWSSLLKELTEQPPFKTVYYSTLAMFSGNCLPSHTNVSTPMFYVAGLFVVLPSGHYSIYTKNLICQVTETA